MVSGTGGMCAETTCGRTARGVDIAEPDPQRLIVPAKPTPSRPSALRDRSLREPCKLEVREIRPLAVFVFLLHQPLPRVFFRGPEIGGVERAVGIFKDKSDRVTVARTVAERF